MEAAISIYMYLNVSLVLLGVKNVLGGTSGTELSWVSFQKNLEIVEVVESKPFNLKTSKIPGRKSNLVMKFSVKQFWYYYLFQNSGKMLLH